MKIQKNNNTIELLTDKETVHFKTDTQKVLIGDLDVSFPGEYEKSGVLLEVKSYKNELFYSFSIEGKNIVVITNDEFEQSEEILSFFGDVDVLIIIGTKKAAKIFENIEARIVVPYGETTNLFLQTLGQNPEAVSSHKVKAELPTEDSEFVLLA